MNSLKVCGVSLYHYIGSIISSVSGWWYIGPYIISSGSKDICFQYFSNTSKGGEWLTKWSRPTQTGQVDESECMVYVQQKQNRTDCLCLMVCCKEGQARLVAQPRGCQTLIALSRYTHTPLPLVKNRDIRSAFSRIIIELVYLGDSSAPSIYHTPYFWPLYHAHSCRKWSCVPKLWA